MSARTDTGPPATRDDQHAVSRLFFDARDYELLDIVEDVFDREDPGRKRLLAPYLHPHGIKEMAAPRPLRIAYAVARLLGSLEAGQAADRLGALRSLRDEVLYTSKGSLRLNAARVLVEIMKTLVRSREDRLHRLELARDFRLAASGKPRVVREQLRRFHLLEMPEEWNQAAFDDHVHDANTKGRKSPSHLILDAWIKGIRSLTVIYYNFVPRGAAEELLEAAAIMGVEVWIGIEFFARHRDKYAKLIWVPRGFSDPLDFLTFLGSADVQSLMDKGRLVSKHHEAFVLATLKSFNDNHLDAVARQLGLEPRPLDEAGFLAFVGTGQASIHHLGRFIHARLLAQLRQRSAALGEAPLSRPGEPLAALLDGLGPQDIVDRYLRPGSNPGLPNPDVPPPDQAVQAVEAVEAAGTVGSVCPLGPVPELLRLAVPELVALLSTLHSKYRITLNLWKLRVEDVAEILYDCRGRITHLETLNLKNRAYGKEIDSERIMELQAAINSASVIKLKRFLSEIVNDIECRDGQCRVRRDKLVDILHDIPGLLSFYRVKPLRSCIGSDSTGQTGQGGPAAQGGGPTGQLHGMGMVLVDSLPSSARRELSRNGMSHQRLPVVMRAFTRTTRQPTQDTGTMSRRLHRLSRRIPGLGFLGYQSRTDWVLGDCRPAEGHGNILTLGGFQTLEGSGQTPPEEKRRNADGRVPLRYLNTGVVVGLKVLAGFLPAFLTFALTKDWWLLAYGGAIIWFAITGLRNIIQSVLGCGGIHRSSLVHWSSLVSWSRLADSLMFTGFSVPLLDYLVKTVLLDRGFGITTATNPLALYSVISLVNGLYLASHNLLRGLPRRAVVGNLFRSVFAIPLALVLSWAAGGALHAAGVADAAVVLQKWAAVISKLASDCMAGVIEGLADRVEYYRMRGLDYAGKLKQVFDSYSQLELLFPMEDVLTILESKEFIRTIEFERPDLLDIITVNSLDLLYFWMYQPRARGVLARLLGEMTGEERAAFLRSQVVLTRERQISQLFLDGLVGKDFAAPLAFYLANWRGYLADLARLAPVHLPEPLAAGSPPKELVRAA